MKITGIVLIVISLILKYIINERRFKRRNFAGMQKFSSYGKAVRVKLIENTIYFIARLLLPLGGVLLIISFFK
ncbi:hypothetical protein [Mucilaginibacter sp. L196]|uniref:hypothetical protein n=1 Tax=Mucilaginibacter sp. L196 TaxID=1641870 RepID=UPI00131DBB32|nr:hypothetical protein [Mucilaginibacter sp. L196]